MFHKDAIGVNANEVQILILFVQTVSRINCPDWLSCSVQINFMRCTENTYSVKWRNITVLYLPLDPAFTALYAGFNEYILVHNISLQRELTNPLLCKQVIYREDFISKYNITLYDTEMLMLYSCI